MTEDKFAGVHQYWAVQERSGNVEEIWQNVLQVIRDRVDETKYSTWFDPLKPLSVRGEMLRIAVPNKFTRAWLMENYQGLLVDTLQQLTGVPYQVTFVVLDVPDIPPPPAVTKEGILRIARP